MSDDSASKRTHTEDALLADVLEEIAERIDQGRAVDIEAYVLAYPHCAERLRRLIPAVQLLSRAGESSSQRGDTHQVVEEERPPARELGDFRLLREIGRGGMGVVYEGEQISLRRRVAVKILPLASALDRRHLQRFRNEAAAAAQLEHPNIVGIYGVGCDRGIQFYAMQFIEGYSLAEVLAEARQSGESSSAPASLAAAASTLSASRGTPTSRKQGRFMTAARIMRDAAEALHYAHSVGIIHRDVKPANLMLDAEGKVWVTDFGLAQIETATGLTLTGDLVGTLRYASPEQALGRRELISYRTDIYSLGACLYELLTLRPAFPDSDRAQLLNRVTQHEPSPPRAVDAAIPRDLETIALKAMAKDPIDRYKSAGELAEDLGRFLDRRPIRARRLALWERCVKSARRHQRLAWAALLLMSVAAVGLAIATVLISRAWRQAEANSQEADRQHALADEAANLARHDAELARELLYAADIRLADTALRDGDPLQVAELVDRHTPVPGAGERDLRGIEWYFLRQRTRTAPRDLDWFPQAVYSTDFDGSGTRLAAAGQDGVVRLYRVRDYTREREFATGQGEVNGLAFSPDGKQLASTGDDGTVRLWDVESGEQTLVIAAYAQRAYQVCFSGDGGRLYTCGYDPVIRIWDARSGQSVGTLEGHSAAVEAIAIAPGANRLVSVSSDGKGRLWDIAKGEGVTSISLWNSRGISACFSHDELQYAVGTVNAHVRVMESKTGGRTLDLRQLDGAQSLAFFQRDQWLAIGDRGGVITLIPLVHQEDNYLVRDSSRSTEAWLAHEGRVYSLSVAPDGQGIVSAGADGHVTYWRPGHQRYQWSPANLPSTKTRRNVAWSPQGKFLAIGSTDGVQTCSLDSPHAVLSPVGFSSPTGPLAVSGDGRFVAAVVAGGAIEIWDRGRNVLHHRFGFGDKSHIDSLAFSADGQRFVARRSNVTDGSNETTTICVFDVARKCLARELIAPQCLTLALSPDGRWLVFGSGNNLILGDLRQAEVSLTTLGRHASTVNRIAFSPDGRRLATTGYDRRLKIWDVEHRLLLHSVLANRDEITAMTFAADGRTIVTGGKDRALRFWQTMTGRMLIEVPLQDGSILESLMPIDRCRLVAVNSSQEIVVFDTSSNELR